MGLRAWLRSLDRGFGYLTLDPSPRLRTIRLRGERQAMLRRGPLPPVPDYCYGPDAVPLDCSHVPDCIPPDGAVCWCCGTEAEFRDPVTRYDWCSTCKFTGCEVCA